MLDKLLIPSEDIDVDTSVIDSPISSAGHRTEAYVTQLAQQVPSDELNVSHFPPRSFNNSNAPHWAHCQAVALICEVRADCHYALEQPAAASFWYQLCVRIEPFAAAAMRKLIQRHLIAGQE